MAGPSSWSGITSRSLARACASVLPLPRRTIRLPAGVVAGGDGGDETLALLVPVHAAVAAWSSFAGHDADPSCFRVPGVLHTLRSPPRDEAAAAALDRPQPVGADLFVDGASAHAE